MVIQCFLEYNFKNNNETKKNFSCARMPPISSSRIFLSSFFSLSSFFHFIFSHFLFPTHDVRASADDVCISHQAPPLSPQPLGIVLVEAPNFGGHSIVGRQRVKNTRCNCSISLIFPPSWFFSKKQNTLVFSQH